MSRGLSTGVLSTLYAQAADDPILALITATHASLTTRRYVRNHEDVTSNSNTFTAAAFDIVLPAEQADIPGIGTLVFDATDRTVIDDLRAVTTPISVLLQIIQEAAPNTVLAAWTLDLRVARWNVFEVECDLRAYAVLDEPYPGQTYSPARFPGLFVG